MEEIKVGEYVRTIDGYIRKVIQVNKKGTYEGLCYGAYSVDKKYKNSVGISAKKIIKHSPNIIDLIEVGDYINGSKLISIDYAEDEFGNCDKLHFYYHFEDDEKDVNEYYEKLIIKSIATKEQFEGIEYRLED